ncbi:MULTISPECIES: DMT family transporter [Vibrio]|uniref:DMT family transporter n=1 Tax=Vibrio TaxID=662 RepID=UPI002075354F|nr:MULTISPECIES: DMT family transporter [Vibrio]USD35119.1 DMT family transporter [Vibrio sp. SCSIO 43186]USD48185.1 DMT family transporter [Vibrio sp. SCSIO 43145]USD72244.1 DMT family transporter [Vibrio sp. SCSIO 43139]USD97919.1 EamA family transporter [Vibrio coralliilyticus]
MIYLLPLLTVFIWGGNSIINKMAASVIEPSAMSFFRWFFAMLVLTPFCLPKVIKQWPIIKPYLSKLAFLAMLGMVLNQSLGYYAGLTTTASNMALITSLVPLLSVFMSVPLLDKKVSLLSIIGGVISLAGLSFMLGQGDIAFFLHQNVTQGDALMVLAACCYAAYCVLIKRWKMPLSNWTLIYMQGIFAVIMLAPLWLSSNHLTPTKGAFSLIAYASIAASILAPWMWVKAIDAIGADSSAMFMNLLPVVAVSLAATLLGENIQSYHLMGGIMVISGVILSQVKRKPKVEQSLQKVKPV